MTPKTAPTVEPMMPNRAFTMCDSNPVRLGCLTGIVGGLPASRCRSFAFHLIQEPERLRIKMLVRSTVQPQRLQ